MFCMKQKKFRSDRDTLCGLVMKRTIVQTICYSYLWTGFVNLQKKMLKWNYQVLFVCFGWMCCVCGRPGPDNWPLGVVQQDEHAGTAVVLEALIVMTVGVPDEIVKYGRVDDIQEPWPCVIGRHFLHGLAVALVVLPPAWWLAKAWRWKLLYFVQTVQFIGNDIPDASHFVTTAFPCKVSESETLTVWEPSVLHRQHDRRWSLGGGFNTASAG